ncbi:hypothetical protein TYRP_007205, partial [Tyrophagus putrescentiae]
ATMWRYSTATKRRTVKLSHDKMSTLRTCHARPAASTLTRQCLAQSRLREGSAGTGPIPIIRPAARSIQGTRKSAPEVGLVRKTGGRAAPITPEWSCHDNYI